MTAILDAPSRLDREAQAVNALKLVLRDFKRRGERTEALRDDPRFEAATLVLEDVLEDAKDFYREKMR